MNCANCGTALPSEANACPKCGAPTPSYHALYGSSPNGPTFVSPVNRPTSVDASKPPSYYSVDAGIPPAYPPYETNSTTPSPPSYASTAASYANPYNTPLPPPPPRVRRARGIMIGVTVLVLLALIGGGVYFFVINRQAPALSRTQAQQLFTHTIAGNPTINDPLIGGDNYGWDNYSGKRGNTKCWFYGNALHSLAAENYFSPCYAKATNFTNFVFQAQMTLIQGHSGGLVFRADSTNDKGYQFRISSDGTCILNRILLDGSGNVISDGETLFSTGSSVVKQGANTLAVLVQGRYIYAFVNGSYIASAGDDSYSAGQIGVYVDSDAGTVEAAFSNVEVWKLS